MCDAEFSTRRTNHVRDGARSSYRSTSVSPEIMSQTSMTKSTTSSAPAKLEWTKKPRQSFIPTMWIGSRDGVERFAIFMRTRPRGRSRVVKFQLIRTGGPGRFRLGEFSLLAGAKAYAERLK